MAPACLMQTCHRVGTFVCVSSCAALIEKWLSCLPCNAHVFAADLCTPPTFEERQREDITAIVAREVSDAEFVKSISGHALKVSRAGGRENGWHFDNQLAVAVSKHSLVRRHQSRFHDCTTCFRIPCLKKRFVFLGRIRLLVPCGSPGKVKVEVAAKQTSRIPRANP